MPKAGFKSITISGSVYDKVFEIYQSKKEDLKMAGINSFAGFVVNYMESIVNGLETFKKYPPYLALRGAEKGRIIIFDRMLNRIAEVTKEVNFDGKKIPFCNLCQKSTCKHVGFCYSLTEFYEVF